MFVKYTIELVEIQHENVWEKGKKASLELKKCSYDIDLCKSCIK
jgi:hypothetical protein